MKHTFRKTMSLLLTFLLVLSSLIIHAPFLTSAETEGEFVLYPTESTIRNDAYVYEKQPDGSYKKVQKAIYCMQYDNTWPVFWHEQTGSGATDSAGAIATYIETPLYDQITAHAEKIRRLLYAGYPFNAIGAFNPLYEAWGSFGEDYAAEMTQNMLWSLMAEWGIPDNTHSSPIDPNDFDDEIFRKCYNNLLNYVNNGTIPASPSSTALTFTGDGTFVQDGDSWVAGPIKVNDPSGFDPMHTIVLPEGVTLLDENGVEIWHGTVGGEQEFYLSITSPDVITSSSQLTAASAVKVPTSVKQYTPTNVGYKYVNGSYQPWPYQTMLSVGMDIINLNGSLLLTVKEEEESSEDESSEDESSEDESSEDESSEDESSEDESSEDESSEDESSEDESSEDESSEDGSSEDESSEDESSEDESSKDESSEDESSEDESSKDESSEDESSEDESSEDESSEDESSEDESSEDESSEDESSEDESSEDESSEDESSEDESSEDESSEDESSEDVSSEEESSKNESSNMSGNESSDASSEDESNANGTPNTGDGMNMPLMISMMVASALGAAALILKMRKKEESDD